MKSIFKITFLLWLVPCLGWAFDLPAILQPGQPIPEDSVQDLRQAEYWLNDDYTNRTQFSLGGGKNVSIEKILDFSALTPNAYKLSLRIKNADGLWSTPYATYFFKRSTSDGAVIETVEKAEYWLNEDYVNRKPLALTSGSFVDIMNQLDFSALSPNAYKLSMRFKGKSGLWSVPYSTFFFKRDGAEAEQVQFIEKAEYWINENYASRQPIEITGGSMVDLTKQMDFSSLAPNAYKLSMRFKNKNGLWSTPYATYFFKRDGAEAEQVQFIEKAEYWINEDYSNRRPIEIIGGSMVDLAKQMDFSSLAPNAYKLSMRFKNKNGLWSSPYATYFFKRDGAKAEQVQFVEKAEYWINENFANRQPLVFTGGSMVDLSKQMDLSSLSPNSYKMSMRFCDKNGLWTVPYVTYFFVKEKLTESQSLIVGYRYWLDNNIAFAKTENFASPSTFADVNTSINLPLITTVGTHTLTLQFKDNNGLFSVPLQFTVKVNSTTDYAWFEADKVNVCGTLAVTFRNLSKGAVSYNWSFGDGQTSTEVNPTHTYSNIGTYSVTLTAYAKTGTFTSHTKNNYMRVYTEPFIGDTYKDFYPADAGDSILLSVGSFYRYRWLLDESTNPYLKVPNIAASYQVEVFNEVGCSRIETIIVHKDVITDLKEKSDEVEIVVYPNPVKDCFTIKSDQSADILNVAVYDLSGRVVCVFDGVKGVEGCKRIYSIAHLKSGIYQLRFETNRGVKMDRIIKK